MEKAVPNIPEKIPKPKYRVPISFALVESSHRVAKAPISNLIIDSVQPLLLKNKGIEPFIF